MSGEKRVIRVGSRDSQLALIQSNTIIDALKKTHPQYDFKIVSMKTTGDNILDKALAKIGEKSLFTKELEIALIKHDVDLVVHSLKDLPSVLPDGMAIGAVFKRDSPHDAVVMHPKHKGITIDKLPKDSVIGSSSVRRVAQLKRRYPHLVFKDIRGNLNTRLRKLEQAEDYDAIILAEAGLDRMGWRDKMAHILEPTEILYAVSQGAMAVECRDDDETILDMLARIHDQDTVFRCIAERALLRTLEGGCSAPVAAYSEIKEKNTLFLKGGVFSLDGSEAVVESLSIHLPEEGEPPAKKGSTNGHRMYSSVIAQNESQEALKMAEDLGVLLAQKLFEKGARPILTKAKEDTAQAIRAESAAKEQAKAQAAKQEEEEGTVKGQAEAKT